MATSRYKVISNSRDEDDDSLPVHSTSERDRSRSVSPVEDLPNQSYAPRSSPPINTFQEATRVNTTEEDVPSRRTRKAGSVDSFSSTLYPEDERIYTNIGETKLPNSSRIKYSFSPSTHHLRHPNYEKLGSELDRRVEASETARLHKPWQQSKRLWRLAAAEWLVTAVLCSAFAGLLVGYEGKKTISKRQLMVFNTISTTLTFLLGVNLAGSMRSYAKMLRWRLLSLCWQPLETFDLVVGCDSLLKVCKLIVKSWYHKSRRLRFGTICLATLWLLSTLGLTLLVGMIGLSYSTGPSNDYRLSEKGVVSITDFDNINTTDFSKAALSVQAAGERGWKIKCDSPTDVSQSAFCGTDGEGYGWYTLKAWNPSNAYIAMFSSYVVDAQANCTEERVIDGGAGDQYYVTLPDERTVNIANNTQNLPHGRGIVAISGYNDSWTDRRWTSMGMFFPRDKNDPIKGQYFSCEVSLSPVWQYDRSARSYILAPSDYQIDNTTSYILAAAMGWNGNTNITTGFGAKFQPKTYPSFSEIAHDVPQIYGDGKLSAENVSDLIVSFAIKAISALDTRGTGIDKFKEVQGDAPLIAQVLKVDWSIAGLLLAAIPIIQLIACVAVFAFANQAIIKDDSPLSIAKLYWTILEKYELGKRGCMLKGSEIVRFISDRSGDENGPMVTYGWKTTNKRDAQGRIIGNLDVFEKSDEGKETTMSKTSGTWQSVDTMNEAKNVNNHFWGINYDGAGSPSGTVAREGSRQRSHHSVSSQ